MATRSEIRHSVIDAIKATVPGVTVLNQRYIDDLDEVMPVAIVMFTDITVTEDMQGGRIYRGRLETTTIVRGEDDDLDIVMDQVIAAVDLTMVSPNPMATGWTLDGIAYDHDIQPGAVGGGATFTVSYVDG